MFTHDARRTTDEDGRRTKTDDGQKPITIAHYEHFELKKGWNLKDKV